MQTGGPEFGAEHGLRVGGSNSVKLVPILRLVTCFFCACNLWCPTTEKLGLAVKSKIVRGLTLEVGLFHPKVEFP